MNDAQGRLNAMVGLLPILRRAFVLIWKAAPGWTAAWICILTIQGILPAIIVSLTRYLINSLTILLSHSPFNTDQWVLLIPTLILAGIMALLIICGQVLQGIENWVYTNQSERMILYVTDIIQEHSYKVDFSFFEKPDEYDHLHRARYESTYRPMALLQNIGTLIQHSITLVAMAALLIPYGIWLPFVLFISTLPVLGIVLYYQRRQHALQNQITPQERRSWYYEWLLTTSESAAELRVLGLGSLFRGFYHRIRTQIFSSRIRLIRQDSIARLTANLAGMLVAIICMLWMGWKALLGYANLGDLVLFYQAFSQGQSLLRDMFTNAGQFYGNLLFLSNLFEFLDLKPQVIDPPNPVAIPLVSDGKVTIEFKEVSFTYPGSPAPILEHFNLVIPAGKITAIMGDNGAGKSTLTKLICRLYDPQSGEIQWNHVNINSFSQNNLHGNISILFQDPMDFDDTVWNDIAFGQWDKQDEIDIERAAEYSGADEFIQQLPKGYQTHLGKMYEDGTNLSQGQWQRVALARAFHRSAPLLLLDEPTSAMDAWAETKWLSHLPQITANRTTLLITHRLTTALHADLIYVMVAGKMVESGTHQELISKNGRYAQAWRIQNKMSPV